MKRVFAPAGVFVALMAVYLWTMAPGNFWLDSAAFAACNTILGLPHSPSFPLYTILGRVIDQSLPVSPIAAANIYSALATASAGVVFYFILIMVIGLSRASFGYGRLFAVVGTLVAFWAIPVWQSAVRTEVYGLQLLLSLLVVYFTVKAFISSGRHETFRYVLAAAYCQGLSLANHPLLGLGSLPVIVLLLFMLLRPLKLVGIVKVIVSAVLVSCIAMSLYLYLPIRANQNPVINSGQPKTAVAALKAITRSGEDYIPDKPMARVDYFRRGSALIRFVYDQVGGVLLAGLAAALIFMFRNRNAIILALLTATIFGLAITVWAADFKLYNYDIVAYAALPIVLMICAATWGLYRLFESLSAKRPIGRIVPILLCVLAGLQVAGNLYATDLSGTRGPDRLAQAILDESPPNAILLVNEDNVLLPLWYHCLALGKRPDLAVISAGALYRPTYRDEIRRLYGDLIYPPEFGSEKIGNLKAAIQSFCDLNYPGRPIMVQFGVPGISADQLAPRGFLFQYSDSASASQTGFEAPSTAMLDSIGAGATDLLTKDFIARAAFNYGVYCDRRDLKERAYQFFQYAIETDGTNPEYFLRLGIAFLEAGRQEEAELLLNEAARTGDGCPEAEVILNRLADKRWGKS